MGYKYIIEIPDDKVSDFLVENNTHLFIPYSIAGYKRKCDTRLSITPYTEPDLELIKQKAHDNGYSEGYQDGYCKGMNDYLQNHEVKEESDRAYAHGYSDAESKFSEIRKEAYQKGYETGYEDGYNEPGKNQQEAYQRGLSDAWEAYKKTILAERDGGLPISEYCEIFGYGVHFSKVLKTFTAEEVIAKIKAYEREHEEIKVGDEVKAFEKKPFIVTGFGYGDDEEDVYCYGFVTENGISTSAKKSSCVRTGRRFHDIDEIFKELNEPAAAAAPAQRKEA